MCRWSLGQKDECNPSVNSSKKKASGGESNFEAKEDRAFTVAASSSMMEQARALRMEAEMLSISRSATIESLQVRMHTDLKNLFACLNTACWHMDFFLINRLNLFANILSIRC